VQEADEIVQGAVDETGLDDFGPPTWREGLGRLVESLDTDAELTPVGELILSTQIRSSLENRLRVVEWRQLHPERIRPVERPVFVLGLPRTGTTLLSYLLDADPANRSLLRWEAFRSVPPPDPATIATDPRLKLAADEMDALYATAPEFKAIHYEAADGPTECVTLLGQDFRSVHFETLANLPGYGRWHESCDMAPAYAWHRSVLQVLQVAWAGRWVLKSPCHNLALEALIAAYPDARFVATHRDPTSVIGSLASLVSVLTGLGTDHDFAHYIGDRWLDLSALMIDRFMAARARLGVHRFHDITYTDLVDDPLAAIARLYDWLGWELPPTTEERFRAYLDANPKGRFGRHEYDLARFGITSEEVADRFADYRDAFAIDSLA
jgi:hypothetical protein